MRTRLVLEFITIFLIASSAATIEEFLVLPGSPGRSGGRLTYGQRGEPKTLNPIFAVDALSREVIGPLMADLIHINRATLTTELALAKAYKVSPDGRRYEVELRRGLRFSDGHPFDADDVIFTFQVYLDPKVDSPQRSLWMLDGKPIVIRKLDQFRVAFDLPHINAVGERIFDSVPMLPRHLLESAYREGRLAEAWSLRTPAASVAGLGPFRLKAYTPGQRIVLERNPYYWKRDRTGNRLPYLEELIFASAADEDLQVMRFVAGDTDVVNRIGAKDYLAMQREAAERRSTLQDAGSGFEYSFLFFNLSGAARAAAPWRRPGFRRAISETVDREAIVRLVYHGFATPLASPVPAGNKLWNNDTLAPAPRSVERARALLRGEGFTWSRDGVLQNPDGSKVEFSLLASTSNSERLQMAVLMQADLKALGIQVNVVPLEFRSLVDRVLRKHDYEACIFALSSPDADPNADLQMWLSSGQMHVWNPSQAKPATSWEAEIDRLMETQLVTGDPKLRKRLFDRVQEIAAQEMPVVPLVSPHILAGARRELANFRPATLEPFALWNVDELYWRAAGRLVAREQPEH